jgi:Zn-dependent peptidase ImmA (M78 family)
MRREDIERVAEKLLPIVVDGDSPAVSVREIAKRLGLAIVATALGEGVSGVLVTEGGRSFIGINEDDHDNRKRFTIAHELGHYVLQHRREAVHVDREPTVSFRAVAFRTARTAPGDPKEVEANQFAACLLMPAKWIRREADRLGGVITDAQIDAFAARFKVSSAAMTIRLQVLGLL